MSVRLIITVKAVPGKGDELAAIMRERYKEIRQEPDCEQFEMFRSVDDPEKFVTLELWKDDAALAAHAELIKARGPTASNLRVDAGQREDYVYNRTR
jgi:quinol monooxygenase YgiN